MLKHNVVLGVNYPHKSFYLEMFYFAYVLVLNVKGCISDSRPKHKLSHSSDLSSQSASVEETSATYT